MTIQILCIIPARSGSTGIRNKNIYIYNGKPLLAWSIEHAKSSKYASVMRVIVSTDNQQYADIAKQYGAEIPFLRPKDISGDISSDYECMKHAIDWLRDNENYVPHLILHLRPTQPCRKVEDVDKSLDIFIKEFNNYDSLRSVIPISKSPYKMYLVSNEQLHPLFDTYEHINEPYNQARQLLPQAYLHNGYIDIFKTSILEHGTISGQKIYPYIMSEYDTVDIDYEKDI